MIKKIPLLCDWLGYYLPLDYSKYSSFYSQEAFWERLFLTKIVICVHEFTGSRRPPRVVLQMINWQQNFTLSSSVYSTLVLIKTDSHFSVKQFSLWLVWLRTILDSACLPLLILPSSNLSSFCSAQVFEDINGLTPWKKGQTEFSVSQGTPGKKIYSQNIHAFGYDHLRT